MRRLDERARARREASDAARLAALPVGRLAMANQEEARSPFHSGNRAISPWSDGGAQNAVSGNSIMVLLPDISVAKSAPLLGSRRSKKKRAVRSLAS